MWGLKCNLNYNPIPYRVFHMLSLNEMRETWTIIFIEVKFKYATRNDIYFEMFESSMRGFHAEVACIAAMESMWEMRNRGVVVWFS